MIATIRDVWNYVFGISYPRQKQLDSLRRIVEMGNSQSKSTALIKSELTANLKPTWDVKLVRQPTLASWYETHPPRLLAIEGIKSPRPRRPARPVHEEF